MTALEYMEKQLQKHRNNYDCELLRGVPEEMLQNIQLKIGYYEAAVEALQMVDALRRVAESDPVRHGVWICGEHFDLGEPFSAHELDCGRMPCCGDSHA